MTPGCRIRQTCPPCVCGACRAQRRRDEARLAREDARALAYVWLLGLSGVIAFVAIAVMVMR